MKTVNVRIRNHTGTFCYQANLSAEVSLAEIFSRLIQESHFPVPNPGNDKWGIFPLSGGTLDYKLLHKPSQVIISLDETRTLLDIGIKDGDDLYIFPSLRIVESFVPEMLIRWDNPKRVFEDILRVVVVNFRGNYYPMLLPSLSHTDELPALITNWVKIKKDPNFQFPPLANLWNETQNKNIEINNRIYILNVIESGDCIIISETADQFNLAQIAKDGLLDQIVIKPGG